MLFRSETVLQDVDAVKYGLYLRQETFTHQTFDLSKNYVTFFNLSGKNSTLSSNSISPTSQYFYDTMNVSYTYYDPTLPGGAAAIQGFQNVYLMTMEGRMTASAPYLPLPALPLSSFYDNQGILKTYNEFGYDIGVTYGTMPYFVFNFIASGNNIPSSSTGQSYTLTCQWDPITVNTLSGYALQNIGSENANLNMLVQVDGKTAVFPAVYVMELVFNQIFIMQVQQKI